MKWGCLLPLGVLAALMICAEIALVVHELGQKPRSVEEEKTVAAPEKVQEKSNDELLHHAVEERRLEKVIQALDAGAFVDALGEEDRTPLHGIASSGCCSIAELLLNKGANVRARDVRGYEPLHLAAAAGHIEMVRFLLAHGADVNARADEFGNGKTPLMCAVLANKIEMVRVLLAAGADMSAHTIYDGETALHLAVEEDFIEMVRVLLAAGADLNELTTRGETAMHCAARGGAVKVAHFLLKAGIDVKAADFYGFTPLHLAVEANAPLMVRFLLEQGANPHVRTLWDEITPLKSAYGRPEVFLEMTKEKSLVGEDGRNASDEYVGKLQDELDAEGQTLLHRAARAGDIANICRMADAGAPFLVMDSNNKTPLHAAIEAKQSLAAVTLIRLEHRKHDEAANLSDNLLYLAQDNDGNEAMHLAAKNNLEEVICELLFRNVPANHRNYESEGCCTPLLVAVSHNASINIVKLFIEKKVDLNVHDLAHGYTPLHWAALHNNAETLKCLLEAGADEQCVSLYGDTPLHVAASKGCVEAARCLLQAGCDVNILNTHNGKTALHSAMYANKPAMVKFLVSQGAIISDEDKAAVEQILKK